MNGGIFIMRCTNNSLEFVSGNAIVEEDLHTIKTTFENRPIKYKFTFGSCVYKVLSPFYGFQAMLEREPDFSLIIGVRYWLCAYLRILYILTSHNLILVQYLTIGKSIEMFIMMIMYKSS